MVCIDDYKIKIEKIENNLYQLKNDTLERIENIQEQILSIETILNDIDDRKIYQILKNNSILLKECRDNEKKSYQFIELISSDVHDFSKMIYSLKGISNRKAHFNGIEILEIQEEERKRVARDLHDSTVQSITGIIYKVEICDRLIMNDPTRVHLELQIIISSLKTIIEDMRSIIFNLHPYLLYNCDLNKYILNAIEKIKVNKENMCIKFKKSDKIYTLSKIGYTTLSRVIGEALNNAVKYSHAKNIFISVIYKRSKVIVDIKDDGKGFSIEEVKSNHNSYGISIMKERISLLGGKFNITSEIGKGTCIRIEITGIYSEGEDYV